MEIKTPVNTRMVEYVCDECGEGKMLQEGESVLAIYPPLYPHKCTNCGCIMNFYVKYPYVEYFDSEEEKEGEKNE